jgi:hypothetical protein
MKRFSTYLTEARKRPVAVWVVGGAASGKSTIAEAAIVKGLKFVLIDPDEPFEKILKKFKLGSDIEADSPEEKKRKAELKKAGVTKTTKMADLKDPMDFFKGRRPTTNAASAVGREITRRKQEDTLASRKNIVFVETGGQVGRIRNLKNKLESEGWRTYIVFVGIRPDLDLNNQKNFDAVAKEIEKRGAKRQAGGGRGLSLDILKKSLSMMEKVKKDLVPLFGRSKMMVDTAEGDPRKNINKVKAAIKRLI